MIGKRFLSAMIAAVLTLGVCLGLIAGCDGISKEEYNAKMLQLKQEYDEKEIFEDKLYLTFTEEYTNETLYHDFTPEDFKEVKLVKVEEQFRYDTEWLRKKKAREEVEPYPLFDYSHYCRLFEITIAEPGRENVYDAAIVLSFREGVQITQPICTTLDVILDEI